MTSKVVTYKKEVAVNCLFVRVVFNVFVNPAVGGGALIIFEFLVFVELYWKMEVIIIAAKMTGFKVIVLIIKSDGLLSENT